MLVVVVLAIRANIIHNCVPAGNFSHLFNPSGNYRRGFFSASAVVLFLKYSVRYVLIVFEPVTAEVHTHEKTSKSKACAHAFHGIGRKQATIAIRAELHDDSIDSAVLTRLNVTFQFRSTNSSIILISPAKMAHTKAPSHRQCGVHRQFQFHGLLQEFRMEFHLFASFSRRRYHRLFAIG